ncbi:Pyruvate kinase (PK) [Durusdinium trenchii]|uniref:Pyruvate kinase n=1 Tax=Durusdinium trenchii TaxID=1381693 RepID=A0ABP0LF02_9DINO
MRSFHGGALRHLRARGLATDVFQQQHFNFPKAYEIIGQRTLKNPSRKTEIICTIGPKSCDPEVLAGLIDAGMNTVRCNMSHGDHAEQTMKLQNLEKAYQLRPEAAGTIKVLMDTRGPEIRTGYFEVYNEKKKLKAGQSFRLLTDYSVKGDETQVAITYKELPQDVAPGQHILLQDGTVILEVTGTGPDYVDTKVLNDGRLGEKKNVNVPGVKINLPVVDEREIHDIVNWAKPHKAHYIALSFVQSAQDIRDCRKHSAADTKIIAKIENVEGLRHFDEILREADGIMVARGDLGMEIPIERIWMAQKMMIKRCKEAGKLVVTATEMLASMEDKPFPTRAEACDVANAVLDGSDMVMLSGEVANGAFPVQTCAMMRRIIEEAEHALELDSSHSVFT